MKRETMPPTVFVEKENQPFEKNAIGMKVAITSRVTIPEMMGNARSFLSSIRIRQLAFTSRKLRIILSIMIRYLQSYGMNVFLPHWPASSLTGVKGISHKTGATPGEFIAQISKKGKLPDNTEKFGFFATFRTTPARCALPPERLPHEGSGAGNRVAGLRHLFTKDLPEVEHTLPDLEPRLHARPGCLLCKCRNVVKHEFTGAGLDIEPGEPGKVCMDRCS